MPTSKGGMTKSSETPTTDLPRRTGPVLSDNKAVGFFIDRNDTIELAQALEDYLNGVRGGLTATTIQSFLRSLKALQ